MASRGLVLDDEERALLREALENEVQNERCNATDNGSFDDVVAAVARHAQLVALVARVSR